VCGLLEGKGRGQGDGGGGGRCSVIYVLLVRVSVCPSSGGLESVCVWERVGRGRGGVGGEGVVCEEEYVMCYGVFVMGRREGRLYVMYVR